MNTVPSFGRREKSWPNCLMGFVYDSLYLKKKKKIEIKRKGKKNKYLICEGSYV